MTSATTGPDAASPLRVSVSTAESATKPVAIRLRSMSPAGMAAPFVGGTTQRMWGPPGPLKLPRSIMSHGPAATLR